jgi:MoaA/NifB/PqqE/SkfB family radical SAM enzyme
MLLKRLRSWGLMRVDLSGGEPTMHRDLAEIARAAVSEELQVVISTNGMVLKKVQSGFPSVRWHVSLDSGIAEIHERSRLLPVFAPSRNSLARSSQFITQCLDAGQTVRVMTCVGKHNMDALFALGEHLALLGVQEWNISRILRAGRAQSDYSGKWEISDEFVLDQIQDLRAALPFIRIRYSNRTDQNGYFLLVLPDGTLATQYSDGRDKVTLGRLQDMSLLDLQNHQDFDLTAHGRKWLSAVLKWQPDSVLPLANVGFAVHPHR